MGKAAEIMASLTSGDVSRHSSRHYGTVTAIDAAHDKVTVLLDGATEPTVCDSRDVKVYDNDRVEVEIRDHKATIKANAKHQVTDDGVALDALDQAAIARGAAEDAVGDAAAAQQAATAAAVSASNAETSAGNAATAATNAQTSAGSAATAASEAQSSAGNAASSASAAQTSAGQAQSSAATAASAAQQASADASAAATAAQAAQTDAATAKRAADRSLVQLSIVEDVAGTLHWIAEHGTYTATSDTTVQDGKVYFELVSGDYVPIAQPTGNPQQQGWYVLDITDSQTEYIMAHLAVTSQGLWVLPSGIGSETTPDTDETQADSDARQGDGYKVLLSSTGMTVYDNYGDAVATYGESTTFASDRDWYVGSSPDGGNPSAFIFFDASENAIQIGGANVTIGGLTPGQLAGSQIWTATADPTTPNYTFAISNLTGPSGVSPRVGDLVVRSYYRYTISSVSTTTVLTGNRTSIRGGTGAAGPEAVVSISVTAADFSAGTATLSASLRVNGTVTTPTSYKWTKGTATTSLGTSQTLSITDLNASYHCTVTWSGGTQVGFIDLTATSAVKTYAAATFATQGTVSSMQSSIEANAGAIELRATKTEAYQISQPNLVPYFSSTPIAPSNDYWNYFVTDPSSSDVVTKGPSFTPTGDGWCRIVMTNPGGSGTRRFDFDVDASPSIRTSEDYTILFEVRNNNSTGGSTYIVQAGNESGRGFQFWGNAIKKLLQGSGLSASVDYSPGTGGNHLELCDDGIYRKRVVKTSEASDSSHYTQGTNKSLFRLTIQCAKDVTLDCELRVSFYEGEYTGPYKPYVGSQLYASQAELKVTNNNVSSKVSTTDYNGQTIASLINQSADSVVIKADHIELNGMTVFNTIKSTLDATYDAKDAASAVQANLDNLQVGGRNYILNSAGVNISGLGSASGSRAEYRALNVGQSYMGIAHGTQVTISFDLYMTVNTANPTLQVYNSNNKGPKAFSSIATGSGSASGVALSFTAAVGTVISKRVSATGYINDRTSPTISDNYLEFYSNYGSSNWFSISNIKLEIGNKPTDWSPAPEDMASASESVEYIVGTQTAKTGSWTGVTRDSSLYAGKTISYKLPYAGDGNASLQLKDASGTNVGGNIAVYLNTTRVTTHFGAGSIIQMTYDGTYWRATAIPNSNNYDRRLHNNAVKAAANIAQYKICCGTSAGYKTIAASVTFDLSYPLLYLSSTNQSGKDYAVASGSTSTAFYEALPSVTFTNTATIESGGAYKMLYLKGTVSGNTFTVAATNFLTTVVPSGTTDPTTFYIPLGMMTSATAGYFATSKDLYAYADGKFRQVNPTDIRASQRIYYCTDLANSELVGPTNAWVTQDGNVYNAWTTKVPPIAASTAEGEDKYPFLYTCEQRKRLDGTIACTDVGLDESVGVIDGGSIIMHSIVAEKIDAHSINSSHVLSVGAFTDEDYELINNADVKEDLGKLSAAFSDYTDVTGQWIHVDRTTGVILGKTGSSDYQQLTNDRQMFVSSGVVVAYTYKGRFYGKAMEAEEMHIGGFMWVARSNGHFSLKYVGGGS